MTIQQSSHSLTVYQRDVLIELCLLHCTIAAWVNAKKRFRPLKFKIIRLSEDQ